MEYAQRSLSLLGELFSIIAQFNVQARRHEIKPECHTFVLSERNNKKKALLKCMCLKYWRAGLPELPHQGTDCFRAHQHFLNPLTLCPPRHVPESRSDRKKMFVVEICADDACLHTKHVTLSSLLVFLPHLTLRHVSVADHTFYTNYFVRIVVSYNDLLFVQ